MKTIIGTQFFNNFKPNIKPSNINDVRKNEDVCFFERIKEKLGNLEQIRLKKLSLYRFRKKASIPLAAVLTPVCGYIDYFLLFILRNNDENFAGVTVIVMSALYAWVTQPRRAYAKSYKKDILPMVANLLGNFSYEITGKIGMNLMKPSKIVPSFDRYTSEDYFTGSYLGVDIEFSEIKLEAKNSGKRSSYTSVFKGLVILLNTKHKRFYGHTIIDQNKGKISEWFKEKSSTLERAEMVDPEFEDVFDAYTNDQVEARYLIDPIMIENLKTLYDEYDGEKMAAAFYENKMLILIASKHNHFEPSNIYTPALDPSSIHNMKKEIGEILSIIEKLSLYDAEEIHRQQKPIKEKMLTTATFPIQE